MTVDACTYENIKIKNGEMVGKWIPCNDEKCPDFRRRRRMIENQEVHIYDVAPAKPNNNRHIPDNISIDDFK